MDDPTQPPIAQRKARRSRRGPTVADVAARAGVSPMTVSRVVNGDTRVMAATREKVDEAIRALGYVPNPAARSLAGGQQCRIALLHSNPSAAYLSEFLVGSLDEASLLDAQLLVERCADEASAEALVARLLAHRVDGVLLPPPLCDDQALLDALRRAGLHAAQIATGKSADFAHAVTIDDAAAAHAVTARLIALGHRRIGFIGGNANQTASALRQAGYELALREAGIAPDPELIVAGDFTYKSGLAAASLLLGRAPRPTAIFASNDDMAAAAVTAAHRFGLEVPRDVSVCGFDDTALATTIWPELTTVRQPIADMARLATRLLVEAIRAEQRPGENVVHERLPHVLVTRESDGIANPPS